METSRHIYFFETTYAAGQASQWEMYLLGNRPFLRFNSTCFSMILTYPVASCNWDSISLTEYYILIGQGLLNVVLPRIETVCHFSPVFTGIPFEQGIEKCTLSCHRAWDGHSRVPQMHIAREYYLIKMCILWKKLFKYFWIQTNKNYFVYFLTFLPPSCNPGTPSTNTCAIIATIPSLPPHTAPISV